jgi:type IV pilus assembly protein PilW
LQEVSNGSTATLKSMLPVTVAQQPAVLLARGEGNLNSPCLVRTVTASADPAPDVKQVLTFGNTGNHNQGVFAVTPDFLLDEPVILLNNLNWNRYELEGTNLVINRRMDNTKATLLPNVIAFRVQYGVTNVSTAIENWRNPDEAGWATITNVTAPQVRAVRIGVVIRSPQREKEDPADNKCKAVPDEQTSVSLFKDSPNPIDITPAGTDWKCYRYRTAELVAPLRNLVSGTNPITWPTTKIVPTP